MPAAAGGPRGRAGRLGRGHRTVGLRRLRRRRRAFLHDAPQQLDHLEGDLRRDGVRDLGLVLEQHLALLGPGSGDDERWLTLARRQRYISYLMAGLVGTIAFLMSTKPQLW